jgi:hypothetical protein
LFVYGLRCAAHDKLRERVLFIGTQFSILYTSMYSPAGAAYGLRCAAHDKLNIIQTAAELNIIQTAAEAEVCFS